MKTLLSPTGQSVNPTHDQIAALAYELYVKKGRPEGQAVADWLRAEQLLKQSSSENVTHQPEESHQSSQTRKVEMRGKDHDRATGSTQREIVRQHTVHPAARHR